METRKKAGRKTKRIRSFKRITVPFEERLGKKINFYTKFLGYDWETNFIKNCVIEKINEIEKDEKLKENITERLMRKHPAYKNM